jgi:CPA2 family monovalent cation:H+ antiporter-2
MSATAMPVLAVALPFLNEMVALFVASVAIAYICYRLRLVPIAGFLIAGVIIGPNALGLVYDQELVDILAEVGVILLLFTIGVEFSLDHLARISRAIFVGGGIQVGLTIGLVTIFLAMFGVSWQAGVYTGCLVALSSTAIVLGLLGERNEIETSSGRMSLAILIFQDLAIVVMVLLVPILAGTGGTAIDLLVALGRALLVIAVVVVLARRVVPWILEKIVKTRRSELFLLAVVAICFGTAAASSLVGLSLALGAFLAGLVVSESRYAEQALSEVLPLRTVFNAVFFVSVGMLLDINFVIENPLLVLGVTGVIMVLKIATTTGGVLALGLPIGTAAISALALAQIGEFSFVLERAGRANGLSPVGLGETGEQTFIAVTVLLMLLTPFFMQVAPPIADWLGRTRLGRMGADSADQSDGAVTALEDHVIVVGYGPGGQRLVQVLRDTGIPFVVVEMNPRAIAILDEQGIPAIYGDAARPHILEKAGVHYAKLCVVITHDTRTAPRVTQIARHLNPTLQIFVRTRFLRDIDDLHELGADVVVPEEMETTVRVFTHVLGAYMISPAEIDEHIRTLRASDYSIVRGSIQEAHLMVLQGLDEEGLHTRAVAVREGAPAAGKTLAELELRQAYGITVIAIRRDGKTQAGPAGGFRVEPGDRLVLFGLAENFVKSADLFRTAAKAPRAQR